MKIMLDPGHGGKSKGGQFGDLEEKEVVLDICRILQDRLQYAHWTAMTRNTDAFVSLRERTNLANQWGADIFVSIHTNADPDDDLYGDPEAKGEEIWIFPGSKKGREFAEILVPYVDGLFPGQKFRGIREARFAVLTYTRMPAVLVELGFLDHRETYQFLSSQDVRRKAGELLYDGIMEYIKRVIW